MTREELNEQIEELEKLRECVSDASLASPALLGAVNTLKDIRDNGITESKKYRILVNHIENSYYEMWLFYEGDGVFNTVSDKAEINTVRSFTRTQIEDLKKNDDVAIDWNKAVIAVGEDK